MSDTPSEIDGLLSRLPRVSTPVRQQLDSAARSAAETLQKLQAVADKVEDEETRVIFRRLSEKAATIQTSLFVFTMYDDKKPEPRPVVKRAGKPRPLL